MTESPWSEYLDAHLRVRGWRPRDLSRQSGVSESRISDWKTKGTPPTVPNARAVAEALDIPIVTLLAAAGVLTKAEARQGLSQYTVRELCDEIDLRFAELAAQTGDEEVIKRTLSGANPLRVVADSPNTAMVRDHQERAWASDAELPHPPGPETGA